MVGDRRAAIVTVVFVTTAACRKKRKLKQSKGGYKNEKAFYFSNDNLCFGFRWILATSSSGNAARWM
jgi:hypothetical protein